MIGIPRLPLQHFAQLLLLAMAVLNDAAMIAVVGREDGDADGDHDGQQLELQETLAQ